jgi:iron complex outermembrane receptor protein
MDTQHKPRRAAWIAFLGLMITVISSATWAENHTGSETEELMDLSLEELLQVTVTTFSRKPQTLSQTPAAIFVVSQSDIRRSGARTIPDVLRMVPGIEVAQLDAGTWAVTARGSNGIFANKLLVLMDGRTLYGPMYSGVRWEIQDTNLADIERIEVIRGPGAVMWGSNAVNGVINIITKNTKDTQGLLAEVAVGTFTNIETTVRWGGSAGDNVNYRVYGKYFDRDGFAPETAGNSYDDWDMGRVGGRIDWNLSDADELSLIGEYYDGTVGENSLANSVTPPYQTSNDIPTKPSGGFALATWNRTLSDTSDFQFRTYYDTSKREGVAPEEERDTIDLDFQHHFEAGSRHDVVWGFDIRNSQDKTTGSETITLNPADRTQRLYSGFLQDEIRLYGEQVFLTLGAKAEKNNFSHSDWEWSPNARLSWVVNPTNTLWTSVAKAVRTPSRIEQDGRILGGVEPPFTGMNQFPVPFAVTINGNPAMDSEEIIAYEVGYRTQPLDNLTFDFAVFFNDYDNLRWVAAFPIVCQPAGLPVTNPACFFGPFDYSELPLRFLNQAKQDTKGLEIAMNYSPLNWWRISAAYSYLKIDGDDFSSLPLSAGEDSPEHQLSLRSNMNVTRNTQVDLWFRYVDELQIQQVDSYITLDGRLAWAITDAVEVSVIGRNLLESSHLEFREEFGVNQAVQVEREALAELRLKF